MNRELTKPTASWRRPISMVAMPMKLTISPTLARPRRCSQVPIRNMAVTVVVAAARVATEAKAHQERTGFCACSSWWMMPLRARDSASMRVKDWITGTLPRASEACSARLE
jgi:hypothetical protein